MPPEYRRTLPVFLSLKKSLPDGSQAIATGPPVRLGMTVSTITPGGRGSVPSALGLVVSICRGAAPCEAALDDPAENVTARARVISANRTMSVGNVNGDLRVIR